MPSFTGVQYSKELECPVCLDLFDDPIEVQPCKHIFCRKDLPPHTCPICRSKYSSTAPPNRIIMNMIMSTNVKCEDCGWVGQKESSGKHKCGTGGAAASTPAVAAPVAPCTPAPYAQQPAQPSIPQVTYGAYAGSSRAVIPNAGPEPWKAYGLSQLEFDQVVAIFVNFDGDDSQQLDRQELKRLARYLNYAHTDRDIERIFAEMDSDGNGTLSLEEFCTWLAYHKPDPQALYGMSQFEYNNMLMQFHEFDTDQSGELSLAQFQRLCAAHKYTPNQQAAQQMFLAIDVNRSGGIDLHEFLLYRAHNRSGGPPLVASHSSGSYPPPQGHSGPYPPPQGYSSGVYPPSGSYPPPQGYSTQTYPPPQQGYPANAPSQYRPQPYPPVADLSSLANAQNAARTRVRRKKDNKDCTVM